MERYIKRGKAEIEVAVVVKLSETEICSIVAAGGGRYVGVVKEIPGHREPVVLFSSPRTRTTLGLQISRLTVEAVCRRITESDAAFAAEDAK